jgi:hypothetical protein
MGVGTNLKGRVSFRTQIVGNSETTFVRELHSLLQAIVLILVNPTSRCQWQK